MDGFRPVDFRPKPLDFDLDTATEVVVVIDWGTTRIVDNDPRDGEARGIGILSKPLPGGRAEVVWSGTGRRSAIRLDRINDKSTGYSFTERG